MTITKLITIVFFSAFIFGLNAQTRPDIYVDDNGVMRWSANNSEIHGFGVNYTLPFAHEYRMAQRTGISLEEAVKQDVYHMARLDLDLYRVHVWDTEISDTTGNLINNDHLKLFDFAISEMKKRGIRFIITPIAYWGNGWPEKDETTPGFSHKYGKNECLTNINAIEAQANYLEQFINHVNPYTGIAYKEEPFVIGFEICNEPHHNESAEKVTTFINKMVSAIRKTGCSKPIFYNMSHSIHLADAYLNANVQGGTFQWYPTNLVANHKISGNFLPHVKSYTIPFADNPKFRKMAKIVYEFDPADVESNIMYPAIAQTFRETGMQLASQFAYDAMCWAQYNTNYGTHFMNLAYTPQKALSLKIASAVFHNVPMYKKYSNKEQFDGFRISYTEDLAEYVTNEKFFYTNNTSSQPSDLSKLEEIAGYGSSPIIKYSGTGAYFLDKLDNGLWRLEIMPDVYWTDDPYSPVSPSRQKAAVLHALQDITINLPDLGSTVEAQPLNEGNRSNPVVSNNHLKLMPGVYLLKRADAKTKTPTNITYKNIRIDEFAAPQSNLSKTWICNQSPKQAVTGKPLELQFKAVSPYTINKISIVLSINENWKTLQVLPQSSGNYNADVPSELVTTGILNYRIIIETNKDTTTFPGEKKGDPWDWANKSNETFSMRIVPENSALELWNAENDWEYSYKIWNRSVNPAPTAEGYTALSIQLQKLPAVNPQDWSDLNYAFKYFFGEKISGRSNELPQKKQLVIKASNLLTSAQPMEIGLIDKNGTAIAAEINITPNENIWRIPLNEFSNGSFLIIPRPFPEFLPYKLPSNGKTFDWSSAEMLQVVVKPGKQENVNLNIERIWLE